jgi:hypothetical protein
MSAISSGNNLGLTSFCETATCPQWCAGSPFCSCFDADGAIVGDALLAETQDARLVIGVSADLDLDGGLLLAGLSGEDSCSTATKTSLFSNSASQ